VTVSRNLFRRRQGFLHQGIDCVPIGLGPHALFDQIGWTMLLTYPLMVAIQEISARIGRTTGHGISGNLCRHSSNSLLQLIVTLLFIANTINIGATVASVRTNSPALSVALNHFDVLWSLSAFHRARGRRS
jgi:hypothetical protein